MISAWKTPRANPRYTTSYRDHRHIGLPLANGIGREWDWGRGRGRVNTSTCGRSYAPQPLCIIIAGRTESSGRGGGGGRGRGTGGASTSERERGAKAAKIYALLEEHYHDAFPLHHQNNSKEEGVQSGHLASRMLLRKPGSFIDVQSVSTCPFSSLPLYPLS